MKVRQPVWLFLVAALVVAGASTTLTAGEPAAAAAAGLSPTAWSSAADADDDQRRRGRGERRGGRVDDDSDSDSDDDRNRDRRGRVDRGRFPFPDRDRGSTSRRVPRDPRGSRVDDIAFDNGHADGYEKGLEDGRDRRDFDPTRHRWYRSADRGYDGRLGSRARYADAYRDGFTDGYEAGYRDGDSTRNGRNSRWPGRLPWPF